MGGIRELRGRIKSVGNIKQITRAMEMVATTKLRRFQDKAVSSRPYAQEITGLVGHLARVLGENLADRPLLRAGTGSKIAVLLAGSDRGLCGAYNSNLFRKLEEWCQEDPARSVDYFVYGRKAYQYLKKRERNVARLFVDPELEKIDYRGAARASRALREAFLSGQYAGVRVLYTAFESMVRYVPTWIELLPIRSRALLAEERAKGGDVLLEPDPATLFDQLLPRYLDTRVYNALVEAITSEYASRRVSMKNATEAAGDMQKELKRLYNRKRQETITKELLDIVGGAEALR